MRGVPVSTSQQHKPVLKDEVVQAFRSKFSSNQSFFVIDGTFGRGGHYLALKSEFPNMIYMALDQDVEAINYAQTHFSEELAQKKLEVYNLNFSSEEEILDKLNNRTVDAVFLDIGVSSPQLDNSSRGFSFYNEGPLDMRMDQNHSLTAAKVLNTFTLEELREIFLEYGETYAPQKLLAAIDEFRSNKEFETTLEFANLIESKLGWRKKGSHPATLYFQALRLYVNKELESLDKALNFYQKTLAPKGIIILITFHSLEDRIAKFTFRDSEVGKPVNKKVIKPSKEELSDNKRARSAKLRVFEKYEGVL